MPPFRSQGYPTWPAPSSGISWAENKSDRTIDTYLEAFLAGWGVRLAEASRAHIEAFLADLLAGWKPATAANRIAADPRTKLKPPAIPEQPVLSYPMRGRQRPGPLLVTHRP